MRELMHGFITGLIACAINALTICLLVWGICLCFGWSFRWSSAIGVWLMIVLVRSAIARE